MNNHKVIFILFVVFFQLQLICAKELTVCYVNWEPFYGKDLPNEGPMTEVIYEAFSRAGYQITTTALPWSRATKKVKNGDIDILLGMYFTVERSKNYEFSDAIAFIDIGLISHTNLGVTQFESMLDLRPYTIGVNQNWVNSSEFDSAYYLKKDPAKNQTLTIRKLLYNRVDMIAVSHEIFKYEVAKQGKDISNYTFIEPKLSKSSLHLTTGKKNPRHKEIITAFNAGLKSMKADGTYTKILKHHKINKASIMHHTSE